MSGPESRPADTGRGWGLDGLVLRAFQRFADRPLIVEPAGTRSYGDLFAEVTRMAARLDAIDEPRRTVGILLPSSADWVTMIAATAVAQWTRVALNTRDDPDRLRQRLTVTGACALVTTPSLLDELLGGPDELGRTTGVRHLMLTGELDDPPAGYDPADRTHRGRFTAQAVHFGTTGGTTGVPKAVAHTPERVRHLIGHIWRELVDPRPGHAYLSMTPMSHASGAFVLPYLLRGAAIAALPSVDPALLRDALEPGGWLAGYRTSTFLVPSAMDKLVTAYEAEGTDASTWFDRIVYGGSPAAPALVGRARATFGDRLVQLFGQAEVPMTVTVLRPEDHDRIGTGEGYCVGRPCDLVDVWIERPDGHLAGPKEIGEVKVAADHVTSGFIEDTGTGPQTRPAEFPLPLGDLGYFDEDGFLWLVGRSRDMIISGGFNVFPGTVEERLRVLAPVADVIVAGAPHTRWGDAVVAGIHTTADADWPATVGVLQKAAEDGLPAYERPKAYLRIDAVPLTALGKPDRAGFITAHAAELAAAWTTPTPEH